MKISFNWLKDYCAFDMAAHQLAERLSHAGLCVESYEPAGGDWMLDVEVTANRPDCLSHLGIAREVAALTGTRVKHPDCEAQADAELKFEDVSSVRVRCKDLCPHYTARVITGVKIAPSPDWMQQRLITCGLRPVNNVVDVTNYVLLEMGQPLHAFDLALLEGRKIIVRRPKKDETITTIDGTEHVLGADTCVIADAERAVAVAGVMGGLKTEIGEATSDVLIESARFHPGNVRRTSRALGLASDSSYRFERGVDPEGVDRASRRACRLLLELAGGRLASGVADVRADKTKPRKVTLRLARLALLLGLEVDPDEVRRIFEGQELEIKRQTRGRITVAVPSWRGDLEREIDLIEEVARIHGYDKIAETTSMPVVPVSMTFRETCERTVRRAMAGMGFDEMITDSLTMPGVVQRAQPWHDGEPLVLRNPVTRERSHMRLTNMAGLLAVKRYNAAHDTPAVDVFELGKVYLPRPDAEDGLPLEQCCLTALTDREDGFLVLKGALANVLEALHVKGEVEEVADAVGEVGPFGEEKLELRLGGELLGCVGIVSEQVAAQYDFTGRPALMEVDFERLLACAQAVADVQPAPRFPSVARDVAVVVDEGVRWAELRRCTLAAGAQHLADIAFFDVYQGEQVPPGKKSVAFSLTFRAPDRTLTGEEVDAARDAIVAALTAEFGASLR